MTLAIPLRRYARTGLAVGLFAFALVGIRSVLSGDDPPTPLARVPWTTSRVVGTPDPPPPFKSVNAFPNIRLNQPLVMAHAPGTDRLFVGEQRGRIVSFRNRPDAKAEVACDLSKEIKTLKQTPNATEFEILYGLVFHPKFAENRYCYVCYTVKNPKIKNLPDGSRVSRFTVTDADPPRLDPDSEEIVFTFLQGGHNGGDLHFGPDGFLYISTGDAADPNPPDPFRTGQDVTNVLSAILRIDVDRKDHGKNYSVPKDNPFVGVTVGGKPARPEVWAYGFRNPWRMSFDRKTGDLWVGDVGWESWEMVHRIEKGGNYGWSIVEARQAVYPDEKPGPTPIRPPVIEIPHTLGASVTGGYVYRGKKFPELAGAYVFGDWETRRLWAARIEDDRLRSMSDIIDPTIRVVALGEDADGELYILDHDAGTINTLERNVATADNPSRFPRTLSATGLFASVADHTPAPGVYRFEINARQWQDFATAEYLVGLPGTSGVTDHERERPLPGSRADWHNFRLHFPKDAVLVKTISLEMERGNPATRRRVETQLLHFDGEHWRGYSYAWRDDQSDADLVPADGAEKVFAVADSVYGGGKREQVWTFHNRVQCAQCHNQWARYSLAFNPEQLNRTVPTPAGEMNQLTWLGELGLWNRVSRDDMPRPPFTSAELKKQPRLADPHGSGPLADRARAYLHVNCAHCHRFGGGGAVDFELHAFTDLGKKVIDAPPTRGTFNLPDVRVIAPGDPGRSILYFRMAKFGAGRMPQLGSEYPDPHGLTLIRDWIGQMAVKNGDNATTTVAGPLGNAEIDRLLNSVASAQSLVELIASDGCPQNVRSQVLAAAAKLPPGNVRDLFEGYLPHVGERKLGSNPRPQAILARKGDAERGKELYWSQKMQCQTCHKLDGQGTDLGPDLSAIGKTRSREDLLESLLEPSRRIDPPYQPYLVRTLDDRTFTGLLVKRDAKEVVLKDSQAKEVQVAAEDLEEVRPARDSIMPTGVLADLTAQQAADLLEYLATRK
jgi:putative heme-binding domain-containing protein